MRCFRKTYRGPQREIDNRFFGCRAAGVGDPGYSGRAKFLFPILSSAFERLANRSDDRLVHAGRIAETDFAFGGMNIYVHECRVEIQKKKGDRELSFHERGVIAFAQRSGNHRTFHRAAVNKDKLLGARLAAETGLANETADVDLALAIRLHREQPLK